MPRISFKTAVLAGFALLVVSQAVAFILIGWKAPKDDTPSDTQLIYNEMDFRDQLFSLSVLPGTDRLYLPELGITVPFNTTTRGVRYSFDEWDKNIRLTSVYMTDHQTHRMSCDDMVRLKVESKPDAYSPSQPLFATVDLDGGRKLQIYASKHSDCARAWVNATPEAIANQFKDAKAY